MTHRTFRVAPGREVVLPLGFPLRSPTGENMRYVGDQTFEVDIDHDDVTPYRRFLRGRVRAGDLIEVDAPRPSARKGE